MYKVTKKINTFSRPGPDREPGGFVHRWNKFTGRDDGNMLFVILFLIFAVGVVIVITATAIASIRKSSFTNNYTVSRTWADAAINDALYTLNNPPAGQTSAEAVAPYNQNNATLGSDGVKQGCTLLDGQRYACWRWWIPAKTNVDGDPIPGMPADSANEFMIYADSWLQSTDVLPANQAEFDEVVARSNSYRKVKAVLAGISTVPDGGSIENGKIVYEVAPPSAVTNAIFGRSSVKLNGGVKVTSYDSDSTDPYSTPTGKATIASNGIVNMDNSVSADRVKLFGSDIKDFADRCLGPLCSSAMLLDTKGYTQAVTAAATNHITNADSLVSGGVTVLDPNADFNNATSGNYKVNGDLVIDYNLTLSPTVTVENPVTIYATGDLIIKQGINVNIPDDGSNPKPARLIIQVAGDTVTIGGPQASTRVAAVIYAPNAYCSSGTSAGQVTLFGSISCESFSANAKGTAQNWRVYYDEAIGRAPIANDSSFPSVWSMANIIERQQDDNDLTEEQNNPPSESPDFALECFVDSCRININPQAGVTSYDMYRWAGAPDPTGSPEFITPIYRTEHYDKGIAPGTRYEYTLYPKNVYGIGPSGMRVGATAPTKPEINMDDCTETTCTITWSNFQVDGSYFQYTLTRENMETGEIETLLLNQENQSTIVDGVTTPLVPGTQYKYTVTSRVAYEDASISGGWGYSKDSEAGVVVALTRPEPPVFDPGATCTTTTCTFSWQPIKSATKYEVYRYDTLGNPVVIAEVTPVDATSTLTYTDANEANESNHKYTYKLKAVNSTGPSQFSADLNLLTLAKAAKQGIATCEETYCDLVWDPNNGVGAAPTDAYGEVQYIVTYRPSNETVWRPAGVTTDPSFRKENLLGGTNFDFRVIISNATGPSNELVFSGLTKPPAPEPDADCSGDGVCTITWAAVTGVENISSLDQKGYRVYRYTVGDLLPSGEKNWRLLNTTQVVDNGDSTFKYVDSGLAASTKYEYMVIAFNASGDSEPGYVGATARPKTIVPEIECRAEATCRLTWYAGDNLVKYDIWRGFPGQPMSVIATIDLANPPAGFQTGVPAFEDSGLLQGTDYIYGVTANAGFGDSRLVETPALTVPAPPALTGNPVCTDVDCTATFTRPQSTTYYTAIVNGEGDPFQFTNSTYTFVGLQPGKGYRYSVTACNESGCSFEVEGTISTLPPGPDIRGGDGITDRFTLHAPFGDPDNPTKVWEGTPTTPQTTLVGTVGGALNDPYVGHYGLDSNSKHCYVAVNDLGQSVQKCRWTAPTEPVVTSLNVVGDYLPGNKLRVMGDPNTFVNLDGTPVMGRSATDWSMGIIVDGLVGNTEYCFTVQNLEANLPTDPATKYNLAPYKSNPTCATTAPDPPTNVALTRAANGSVDINWTAPAGPIEDYIIEYKLVSSNAWIRYNDGENTNTFVNITGLVSGGQYAFRIIAKGVGGESAPSQTVYYRAAETPGAPTNLTATMIRGTEGTGGTKTTYVDGGVTYVVHTFTTDGTFDRTGTNPIYLTWTAPTVDGGAPVTDYQIDYRIKGTTAWTTFIDGVTPVTYSTVTGLNAGATYEFRVAGINSVGAGDFSNTAEVESTFVIDYMLQTPGSSFTTAGVVYGTQTTTQCPAGTTLVGGNLCRDDRPATRTWGQVGWSCPSGGNYIGGGTCRVTQGYDEPYISGYGPRSVLITGDPAVDYGNGLQCPAQDGWFVGAGGRCQTYITVWDVPIWSTRRIDTSYNYGATPVYGYATDATPAGWSGTPGYNGTWPTWTKDTPFTRMNMTGASGTAVAPAASTIQVTFGGTSNGEMGTIPAGSVTVRYPQPMVGSTAVRNLIANMGITVNGGTKTTASGYQVHTFNSNGVLTITPADRAVLTWDAPTTLGGEVLIDYRVEYKKSTDVNWTVYNDGVTTTTGAAVAGLETGVSYNFRVTPVTKFGFGATATATPAAQALEYLAVAGGGGGGTNAGGGGGAGGVSTGLLPITASAQSISITVGAGGTGATSGVAATPGGTTAIGSLVTVAGGGIGGSNMGAGQTGGSGGGGSMSGAGAAGTSGQGNAGAGGAGASLPNAVGGGGGGAGGAATAGSATTSPYTYSNVFVQTGWDEVPGMVVGCTWYPSTNTSGCASGYYTPVKNPPPGGWFDDGSQYVYVQAGTGGAGVASSISGSASMYGVGGAGANNYSAIATQGSNGAPGTGNGGGGSATGKTGGNGGSGIVIVRFVPATPPPSLVATGGNMSTTTIGGRLYKVHTFLTSGNFTITSGMADIEYFVVGGGGGGGGRNYFNRASGGGGAGGVTTGTVAMTTGTTAVTVGSGGAGAPASSLGSNGGNGQNSMFGSIIAYGGGGGARPNADGQNGGSGGGGAMYEGGSVGGQTLGVLQGNVGASTIVNATSAGGGGGAGAAGSDNGAGGAGIASDIRAYGSPVTYAVGGDGGNTSGPVGGGNNTGNGGKGGLGTIGGSAGGSGIVVLRYPAVN